MSDSVNEPCQAWKDMNERWDLITDLLGGTQCMRDRGEKWLPREKKEEDLDYWIRRDHTFLFPAMKDTIDRCVAKPFSRAVTHLEEDKLHERLMPIMENADNMGTGITQFMRNTYKTGKQYGMSHVLVEHTRNPDKANLAGRPYFTHIPPTDLIQWPCEVDPLTGEKKLIRIHIRERRLVQEGRWSQREVNFVRVIYPDHIEIYQEVVGGGQNDDDFQLVEELEMNHPDGIPIVTYQPGKVGFMTAQSPFEDLSWLNLRHWQSSSEQNNILRFLRMPILAVIGADQEEDNEVTITMNRAMDLPIGGDVKWVEHSGNGVKAGTEDLQNLERQMEVLGLRPFMQKGDIKATGQAINEAGQQADIQAWIRDEETAFLDAWRLASRWPPEVGLPEGFIPQIFSDFQIFSGGIEDLKIMQDDRTRGDLDRETYLRQLKRFGKLDENTTVEDVLLRLQLEAAQEPSLMTEEVVEPEEDDEPDEEEETKEEVEEEETASAAA